MSANTANAFATRMVFRNNFSRQKELKDEIKRLLAAGEAKKALKCCDKALMLFPEHAVILHLRKEARNKLGLPSD